MKKFLVVGNIVAPPREIISIRCIVEASSPRIAIDGAFQEAIAARNAEEEKEQSLRTEFHRPGNFEIPVL